MQASFIVLTVFLSLVFIVILVSLALSLSRTQIELPENRPEALLEEREEEEAVREASASDPHRAEVREQRRPLVVCAGDSITHGAVSVNYVDILSKRMPQYEFSNGGVNSELAYNLTARLDPIIKLKPKVITILIGTNDVNATFGLKAVLGYYALHKLPEVPNLLFYRENLTLIARRLKNETDARIAFLSIPPIGETVGTYVFLRSDEYSQVVREIAAAEGVSYLPLHEKMAAYLKSLPPRAHTEFQNFSRAQSASARSHFLLGRSFDEISAANGFYLLVDGIHLNSVGAAMVADLIGDFIEGKQKS